MANTYSINTTNISLPQNYQINGTVTSASWTNGSYSTTPSTNFVSSNHKSLLTIPHGEEKLVLEKEATLDVKGNVRINGIDLEERLKTIESILMIPERDVILETKYPSLKKKYDEYIKALAKYRTWEAIKGEDND